MKSIKQMTQALLLIILLAAAALAFTLFKVRQANNMVAQVNLSR